MPDHYNCKTCGDKAMEDKSYSKEQVREMLKKKGHSDDEIDLILEEADQPIKSIDDVKKARDKVDKEAMKKAAEERGKKFEEILKKYEQNMGDKSAEVVEGKEEDVKRVPVEKPKLD